MSHKARHLVKKHSKATGLPRFLLYMLADYCNEERGDMEAWPTITTLAEDLNVKRQSASRAMQDLIKLGEITDTGKKIGRNQVYKITVQEQLNATPRCTNQEIPPQHHVAPDATPRFAHRNTTLHKPETTIKELEYIPPIVPQPNDDSVQLNDKNVQLEITTSSEKNKVKKSTDAYDWKADAFKIFWDNYPTGRKLAPDRAEKAFRKKATTQEIAKEIIHGVIRHAEIYNRYAKDDRQYIPHAATWLNDGRWKGDDPAEKKDDTGSSDSAGSNKKHDQNPFRSKPCHQEPRGNERAWDASNEEGFNSYQGAEYSERGAFNGQVTHGIPVYTSGSQFN